MFQLLFAGILGGLVVVAWMKFPGKNLFMKFLLKIFYIFRDWILSAASESLERFRDLAAESKQEYEKEKVSDKSTEEK